jgi:hypothetical protein
MKNFFKRHLKIELWQDQRKKRKEKKRREGGREGEEGK